jgi:hypothetical protein
MVLSDGLQDVILLLDAYYFPTPLRARPTSSAWQNEVVTPVYLFLPFRRQNNGLQSIPPYCSVQNEEKAPDNFPIFALRAAALPLY